MSVTLREKIKKIRVRGERIGAACCGYVRLTKKYSLKLYYKEKDRDRCFFRQSIAYNLGFGPKNLFKVKKSRLFGYVTEHANTMDTLTDEQFEKLTDQIEMVGWSIGDLEPNVNVGLIGNKPVLIDYDDCTLAY